MTGASGNLSGGERQFDHAFAALMGITECALVDGFFSENWERSPVRWPAPEFPIHLTLAEIEALFHAQAFRESDIRLVRNGEETLDLGPFLDQRGFVQPHQVWAAVEAGATAVLKHFDTRHAETRDLCRRLELLLHHAAIANLYITPAGFHGLPLHQDFHDVLVCQLDGVKNWEVFNQRTIPTEKSPPFPPKNDLFATGPLLFEHALQRGEVMYLPRGCHHRATAQQQNSVHITIGLHTKKWSDLMTVFIADLAEKHEVFRRSLPPGFLADGWVPSDEPEWKEMLACLSNETARSAVGDLRQRMLKWRSVAPPAGGASLASFVAGTHILRKTGFAHLVPRSEAEGGVCLHMPGLTLEKLDYWQSEFVSWALNQEWITVEKMPAIQFQSTLIHDWGSSESDAPPNPIALEMLQKMVRTGVFTIESRDVKTIG